MANRDYVINVAKAELGYLEKSYAAWKKYGPSCLYEKEANAGSDNYTKYGYEMNQIYPKVMDFPAYWCDCFIDWCFYKAYGVSNAKGLLGGDFDDYTKGSINLYKSKDAFYLKGKKQPELGMQVFFSSDGTFNGVHHTGLVIEVSSSKITTIEGNTTQANKVIPNGGAVVQKQYSITDKQIYGYGLPKYDPIDTSKNLNLIPIGCGSKGLKIVGASSLNIRDYPVTGKIIDTYKFNDYVQCSDKIKGSDNNYWFKTDKGFISGKYLEGWIKEAVSTTDLTQRWWYVKEGYTYDSNKIVNISNKWYAFDKNGWLIEQKNINSDGSIKM